MIDVLIATPLRAHGLAISVEDLPLPLGTFYIGAAAALALSFALLAAGLRSPTLSSGELVAAPRLVQWVATSRLVRWVLGALALGWLVATIVTACFGSTENSENAAPNLVFVLGWIGIPLAALLLGRGALWLHPVAALARLGGMRETTDTPPPARLGVWLAWGGLVVFTWLELVFPTAIHIRTIGVLVLAWTVTGLVGASRWGVRPWLENVDPFGAYTRVLASLAPWGTRGDGRVGLRPPLVGPNRDLPGQPGLVSFVTLLIGTVSFDGLTRTGWWQDRVSLASADLTTRGISAAHARIAFGSMGLLVMVVLIWALFEAAAWAAVKAGRLRVGRGTRRSAQAFAPSLVPIALAYVVAHYFSFFVVQVQDLARYASDPLGTGHNYFGTANDTLLDLHVPSGTAVWMVQVVAIVVGHVAGLLVAHDRALELAPSASDGRPNVRRATLSQLPLLALMLLYTIGGLYFLSEGLA